MTRFMFRVVLLVGIVLPLCLAGCGGGDRPGQYYPPAGGNGFKSGPTPTPVYGSWEITGDGCVDAMDSLVIGQHWGERGDPGWIEADVNEDGVIDESDIELVQEHLGEGCP